MTITQAVQAVKAVSAYKKPEEYRLVRFFGHNNWWNYVAVFDDRLCEECEDNLEIGLFNGDKLRGVFPEWVIMDENTIMVHVHPNCRCYLTRVTEPQ